MQAEAAGGPPHHHGNARNRARGPIMEAPIDHVLPVSVILSRLEKHRDEIEKSRETTPRWRFIQRQRLLGAQAAYAYEIEQLLEKSSGWQPFWKNIGKDEK